jgi:hypothetical protein
MSFIVAQNDAQDVERSAARPALCRGLRPMGSTPPAVLRDPGRGVRNGGEIARPDDALAALGPGPFAVRSSARAEDGAEHSHAGQFDTFLNVAAEDVWTSAQKVWRSGFSDTVATYRAVKTGGAAEAPPSSSSA